MSLQRVAIRATQRRFFHRSRALPQAHNIIQVENGTFYRDFPSPLHANVPLVENLTFSLPTGLHPLQRDEFWAIVSPSSLTRTNFLQVLGGRHFCDPPHARTYPHLADLSRSPHDAIQYVGFDADRGSHVGGNGMRGAYLSARYEARREETDYSLHDYLTGHTELNALHHETSPEEAEALRKIIDQLHLGPLLDMPVANLSNGQTRRARIAKALTARPEVLLLDGPFMGLDPQVSANMARLLHDLAKSQAPRLIVSLRPEDDIPDWITHLVRADSSSRILDQGSKISLLAEDVPPVKSKKVYSKTFLRLLSKDAFPPDSPALPLGEPIVEMRGVQIKYGSQIVLGDWTQRKPNTGRRYPTPGLHWSLHRGQRTAIFGPNGSGKTTLLSLITSDHPQTYSQPILHFSRSRLPSPGQPGISLFDLQSRIGHSSPEIHAFFPKHLSVRQVLESAWSETPLSRPKLTASRDRLVDSTLRWFARELNPFLPAHELTNQEKLSARLLSAVFSKPKQFHKASLIRTTAKAAWNEVMYDDEDLSFGESVKFRDLSFASQRLALFLRALVGSPDLVILDEAFSGMDAEVRDKAMLWMSRGERIAKVEDGVAVKSVQAMIREGEDGNEGEGEGDQGVSSSSVVDDKIFFQGLEDRQALVVIAHEKGDVPGCVREWICLPDVEKGSKTMRRGVLDGPLELLDGKWEREIWGGGDGERKKSSHR